MGLARFRLVAGQHIGPDKKAPKDDETGKHPSKVFNQGDAVWDNIDLVAKHGATKFVLEKGSPDLYVPPGFGGKARAFPQGQVIEGKQVTLRLANGKTITGVLTEDHEKERFTEDEDGNPVPKGGHRLADDLEDDDDDDRASSRPRNAADSTSYSRGELEAMTVPALKALASDEDIDLDGASRKEDIIDAISKVKGK